MTLELSDTEIGIIKRMLDSYALQLVKQIETRKSPGEDLNELTSEEVKEREIALEQINAIVDSIEQQLK